MFGTRQVDVLGASVFKFIDTSNEELFKKTMNTIYSQAIKEKQTGKEISASDSMEISCQRPNATKFPARVSIFAAYISGKGIQLITTIKDITSETKQQALLTEEKKNSETLLKNILPEAVANRLKKGETFIAEKFKDVC